MSKIINTLCDIVNAKTKRYRIEQGSGEHLSEYEKEMASKVGISVDSAKGCGKTSTIAQIIHTFLILYAKLNVKIICTAPKIDLLKDSLWGEISRWKKHSINKFGNSSLLNNIVIQGEKVYLNDGSKEAGKDSYCIARTVSKNAPYRDW